MVGLLVAAGHWPALQATAVGIDDHQYLTRNPLVQAPGWTSVRTFFGEVSHPSTVQGYYQPLSMVSLMLDSALGGDPQHLRAYHRTSLLLHAANAALLAILLYLLLGSLGWACAIGLLFGLHPLSAWETPWVSERKTLLATFFGLAALAAWVRYAKRRKTLWYVTAWAAFLLALLSKPTTVTLPAVMVLLDFWPLHRLDRRSVLEKLPFFGIALVFAAITLVSQAGSGSITLATQHSAGRLPMALCHHVGFYLSKAIWPVGLSAYYSPPEPLTLSNPAVLSGVVAAVLLLVAAILSLRWTRALFTCLAIFLVLILPTLGLVRFTDTLVALRHLYLPMIGLALLGAWLLTAISQRLQGIGARAVLGVITGLTCVAAAHGTRQYIEHWRSTEGLFAYMAGLAPTAGLLRHTLGQELASQGRLSEAIAQYRSALDLRHASARDKAAVHSSLGVALQEQGALDEAIACFQAAVQLHPALREAQYNLGVSIAMRGKPAEAAVHLLAAVHLFPDDPEIHLQLGNVLLIQGKPAEAIRAFEQALELSPNMPEAHNNMGFALASVGQPAAAEARFRRAIELSPGYADALWNLGRLLFQQGRYAEADAACAVLLQHRSGHAGAKALRATVAAVGRPLQH